MKGLLARMSCKDEGRKRHYPIVLGDDAKLYPGDDELADRYEDYQIALEMGFEERELWLQDDCMYRFSQLAAQPRKVLCAPFVLDGEVLSAVVLEWVAMKGVPSDFLLVMQAIFEPEAVATSLLVRRKMDLDETGVSSDSLHPEQMLAAASKMLLEIVIDVRKGKVTRATYNRAYKAGSYIRDIMRREPSYRGLHPNDQYKILEMTLLVKGLKVVDSVDAWTVTT